jgi:DNA-binding transcriptional ArsR family regulator
MTKGQSPERSGQSLQGHAPPPAVGAPAAAGTPGNPLRITDPRVMRAMAHPARIAILQHLALDGPSTATECAEIVGLSPSACSYHLRALGQYGFVEEDRTNAADGRQRPWRATVVAVSLPKADMSPATQGARLLLEESLRACTEELARAYQDRQREYPARWRELVGSSQDVVHVTPEELQMLRQRIDELLGEYRRLPRGERPPDARRIHVRLDLLPWFEPDTPETTA